jgi:hypothetical protein
MDIFDFLPVLLISTISAMILMAISGTVSEAI